MIKSRTTFRPLNDWSILLRHRYGRRFDFVAARRLLNRSGSLVRGRSEQTPKDSVTSNSLFNFF